MIIEQATIVRGLANWMYHSGPGLSHSGAKRLRRSPFHFHALAQPHDAPPKEPTPAMFNGTLVHCALLEPNQFDARYVVAPEINKRSRSYKEFDAAAQERGLQCISQTQRDAAFRQADQLRTLPEVADLLDDGEAEVSAYWDDPATGVMCKCRPDFVSRVGHGDGVVLLDVKTASDASKEGFAKACANYGYHTQADWYCEGYAMASGLDVHGMVFAVVESEYPHACAAYMLDDESLRAAHEENAKARALYARCTQAAHWPSYHDRIEVISLPHWAMRKTSP